MNHPFSSLSSVQYEVVTNAEEMTTVLMVDKARFKKAAGLEVKVAVCCNQASKASPWSHHKQS